MKGLSALADVGLLNARALTAQQVANSFVCTSHFEHLAKSMHTVLVGPRGSGKTTLLKMLLPESIEHWSAPEADRYRASIDYYSCYIPTDVTINAQLSSMTMAISDPSVVALLTDLRFTLQVMRALTVAVRRRVHAASDAPFAFKRCALGPSKEADLAQQLAITWNCPHDVLSLRELLRSLDERSRTIQRLQARALIDGTVGRPDELVEFAKSGMAFPLPICQAVDILNEHLNDTDGKWALLFDELELAPAQLQQHLVQLMRSVDSRLIFKFALAPFSAAFGSSEATAPSEGNDYNVIRLWNRNDSTSRHLFDGLWYRMLSAHNITAQTPREA